MVPKAWVSSFSSASGWPCQRLPAKKRPSARTELGGRHVLDTLSLLAGSPVVDVVVVKVVVGEVALALLALLSVDNALSSQLSRLVSLRLVLAALRDGQSPLPESGRSETHA